MILHITENYNVKLNMEKINYKLLDKLYLLSIKIQL